MSIQNIKGIKDFFVNRPDGKKAILVTNTAPVAYDANADELKVKVPVEKGVLAYHQGVGRLVETATRYFGVDSGTSFSNTTPVDVAYHKIRKIKIVNRYKKAGVFVPIRVVGIVNTITADVGSPNLDATYKVLEIPANGIVYIDETNTDYASALNSYGNGMVIGIGRVTDQVPDDGFLEIYFFGEK